MMKYPFGWSDSISLNCLAGQKRPLFFFFFNYIRLLFKIITRIHETTIREKTIFA